MRFLKMLGQNHYSYFLSVVTGVVPLALVSILTLSNGSEFMGGYFYYLSFISMAQVVVDYGFNMTGIRTVTKLYSESSTSKFWSGVLGIICAKALLGVVVLSIALLLLYIGIIELEIVLYILIGVLMSLMDISWFFYSINLSIYYTGVLLILKVAFLFPLFLINQTIFSALMYSLLPSVFATIVAMALIAYKFRSIFNVNLKELRPNPIVQLKDGYKFFTSSFFASFISVSWPAFLSLFIGISELGVYGIANKIMRGLASFLSPLSQFFIRYGAVGFGVSDFITSYRAVIILLIMIVPVIILALIPLSLYVDFFGVDYPSLKFFLLSYAGGYFFLSLSMFSVTNLIIEYKEIAVVWLVLFSWSLSALSLLYYPIFMPLVFEIIFGIVSGLYVYFNFRKKLVSN